MKKRILAVGNSFSQDASRYLEEIAEAAGTPIFERNLYIGGCSLERHADNIRTGASVYEYQIRGQHDPEHLISLQSALQMEHWDIVTVQQVSGLSGLPETYEPYLSQLLEEIRSKCPQAQIYFHSTWAYEWGSDHPDFAHYENNQEKMAECIQKATQMVRDTYRLPVIPSGELIAKLRTNPEFDIRRGGTSLCRDGFHLSLDYGRYAVGLLWYKELMGQLSDKPPILFSEANMDLLRLIWKTVQEF